jgi:RimJ/RimL family protein N-acetyltransferase
LLLRRWRDSDRPLFALMNADPVVMEHFPAPMTQTQSDEFVDRIEETFEAHGFGFFAVEIIATGEFIGYVGLWRVIFEAHFTPAMEIGWRLAHKYWGRGYATEAARVALLDGFERLELAEIVSFTTIDNHRSERVMQKLGMTSDPEENFDHPYFAEGHPMSRNVLYRIQISTHRSGVPTSGVREEVN